VTLAEVLDQMLWAWVLDIESVEFPHFTYPEGQR
jgi:hypothetical protein